MESIRTKIFVFFVHTAQTFPCVVSFSISSCCKIRDLLTTGHWPEIIMYVVEIWLTL